ncbi:50S ribosomal protein L17, partial [Patescibacteria group bacterium]
QTTESKAKISRRLFEKLVTKAKKKTVASQRLIHAFLQDKKAVFKLSNKIAPLFQKREGGFTRIIRLGERRGDQAKQVILELVEKTKPEPKKETKRKTYRKKKDTKSKPEKKRALFKKRNAKEEKK